jgi:acyl-CoA thioesterase FadM
MPIPGAMALRIRERVGVGGWIRFIETFLHAPELDLRVVGGPALVVSGGRDFAAPQDFGAALADRLLNARFEVLDDVVHFPMLEQPGRLAQLITGFLADRVEQEPPRWAVPGCGIATVTGTGKDHSVLDALADPTVVEMYPRFEGSNICTWIGFKHVCYLLEEAVLEHFRRSGLMPRQLFEKHGLGLDIVDTDARILFAIHMDDLVRLEVAQAAVPNDGELVFSVAAFVERNGRHVKAVSSTLRVVLRKDSCTTQVSTTLDVLAPYTVNAIDRVPAKIVHSDGIVYGRGEIDLKSDIAAQLINGQNAVVWKWRIPYFYCHFTERIQQSGYLRLMEEIVDIFLHERDISIRTLLNTKRWIPVVPRARVQILREALMEEQLYTVFTVQQVFKDVLYSASMDSYVLRDGALVHTATGSITHGYAVINDRRDWELIHLDEVTLTALRGDRK